MTHFSANRTGACSQADSLSPPAQASAHPQPLCHVLRPLAKGSRCTSVAVSFLAICTGSGGSRFWVEQGCAKV